MAENKQLDELEQDPGLAPGHAAIKDLEPEHDEAAAVERGIFIVGGAATRGLTE